MGLITGLPSAIDDRMVGLEEERLFTAERERLLGYELDTVGDDVVELIPDEGLGMGIEILCGLPVEDDVLWPSPRRCGSDGEPALRLAADG